MKHLFLFVILAVVILISHNSSLITTYAASEFSSSYGVRYDVGEDGVTTVIEDVKLKNLTEKFYAKSFNLTIGATQVYDVLARDSQGELEVSTSQEGSQTNIKVNFSQQIAGVGKEYPWTLTFKSKDFAQKQGKVWQVSIPKISSSADLNEYDLTLAVPVSFGDPSSIHPDPISQSEKGGEIIYQFQKHQLLGSGILANFGTSQTLKFLLTHSLRNSSFLPIIAQVALPPKTDYQDVSLAEINPHPENVIIDSDGNQVALFKLNPRVGFDVTVSGFSRIYVTPKFKERLTESQINNYTKTQDYWEVGNPALKIKLQDILKEKQTSPNTEKAALINQFVVDTLKYNPEKLSSNQQRLGALTALNNPEAALCQEFNDLFITLARTAKIPARELLGYAYTSNNKLRPLSFKRDDLHCWSEYYDPNSGWVMIDPTWQQTSGGVDYFNKFDLNHFVIVKRGVSSTKPPTPDQVNIEFSEELFTQDPKLSLDVDSPSEVYGAIPAKLKIKVENKGNSVSKPTTLVVNTASLQIVQPTSVKVPAIAAFGHSKYEFALKSQTLWQSYDDILEVSLDGQEVQRKITIKPFFALKYFPLAVFGVLIVILSIYFGVLGIHMKSSRQIVSKVSSTKISKKGR